MGSSSSAPSFVPPPTDPAPPPEVKPLEFQVRPDPPSDGPWIVFALQMPVYSVAWRILTSYSPSDGGPTRLVADYRPPYNGSHGLNVWDCQSGRHLAFLTLSAEKAVVVCAITYHNPSTGRAYIAAAHSDGHVAVWCGDDFRLLFTKDMGTTAHPPCLTTYTVSGPAGDVPRVVMGMADGSVAACDGETGEPLPALEGLGSRVEALLACAAGTGNHKAPWLVAGGSSTGLRAFEPETGRTLWSIDPEESGAVRSLALLEPDTGAPLLVSGGPHDAKVWDLRTGTLVRTLVSGGTGGAVAVAVYREPRQGAFRIIAGGYVHDAETGERLRPLAAPGQSVIVFVTAEGAVRVVGSESETGVVMIADPEAGTALHTLCERHEGPEGWPDMHSALLHRLESEGRQILLVGDDAWPQMMGWDLGPIPLSQSSVRAANHLG
jgi:outer membrane protein assembly factor BamB